MKENPLVYIVILNWNGLEDTLKCINSLKLINYINYKIILVDNGSTNESVEVFKIKIPEIELIETKKNLGFSGGCNVGISYALENNADYILLLNNDTFVNKDFLSELIIKAEKNNNIGAVAPKIYYFDKPNIIWSAGTKLNFTGGYPFILNGYREKDLGQYEDLKDIDSATGCCLLIKREVLDLIGFFDDDYFLYVEDMDLCARIKKAGYKILFVPNSKIYHRVSSSSGGEDNALSDYYNNRNFILYARKNLNWKKRLSYYYFVFKGRLYESIIFLFNGKYKKSYATIKGLYHGFLGKKGYYPNI